MPVEPFKKIPPIQMMVSNLNARKNANKKHDEPQNARLNRRRETRREQIGRQLRIRRQRLERPTRGQLNAFLCIMCIGGIK